MKKKCAAPGIAALCAILLFPGPGISKECPLLTEKQGTFEFLSRTDYAWHLCGFTAAEVGANLKEVTALVQTVRGNRVLAGMKGFDARVALYTVINCTDAAAYGIPVRVSFGFCSWFQCDGKNPSRILMEPPEWSVIVNDVKGGFTSGFSNAGGQAIFGVPGKKETVRPGIDVYDGEIYVIYNPDRPRYWLPVTVREAYNAMVEDAKKDKDAFSRDFMLKHMEKEYAAFPEADRGRPAYTAGTNGQLPRVLGRLSADATGSPIMRVNPAYWNRGLPRSAIQFMYCRIIGNRAYLKKEKDWSLKKNSIGYNLLRFLEMLDIGTAESLLKHVRR